MFSNMLFAATDVSNEMSNLFVDPAMLGGIFALFAGMLVFFSIISIAIYVYKSLALQTIGKKLNYKYPWLAWIPIADWVMILELGEFHWALIFLLLVPVLGWIAVIVLLFIAFWRILEKRNYPGWLVLFLLLTFIPFLNIFIIIGFLVILGMAAWKER